ncbi:hypothetical protein D3C87_2165350 [compost metagenome]
MANRPAGEKPNRVKALREAVLSAITSQKTSVAPSCSRQEASANSRLTAWPNSPRPR